jgi:hypothetical protein
MLDDGGRHRTAHSFFGALRAFLAGLVDGSGFRDVSLGREISLISTANGLLVYRWETNDAADDRSAIIARAKWAQRRS